MQTNLHNPVLLWGLRIEFYRGTPSWSQAWPHGTVLAMGMMGYLALL